MAVIDTFDRADAGALGTASDGGTWTGGIGGGGGFAPNAPGIVSNKAKASGGYRSAYHSLSIGPDCYVGYEIGSITVIAVPFLLVTNAGSSSKTGYEFDWIPSTGSWEIYKTASGVDTLIASGTLTFPSSGSLVMLYLNGTTVGAKYSTDGGATWLPIGSVTDNTHRGSSTKPAIVMGTDDTIDNFFAGTSTAQNVGVSGKSSGAAFGTVAAAPGPVSVAVAGKSSVAAFGAVNPTSGGIAVAVAGKSSVAAFGTVTPSPGGVVAAVAGKGSGAAFGAVTAGGGTAVAVAGLGSAAAFGTVTPVPGGTTKAVPGLGSAAAFGTVTTSGGAVNPALDPARRGYYF